jgi:hypothetical protein
LLVLKKLSLEKKLVTQRGVSSIPSLNNVKYINWINYYLKKELIKNFYFSINFHQILNYSISNNDVFPFGGIIFYSGNFGSMRSQKNIEDYIKYINEKFKISYDVSLNYDLKNNYEKIKLTIYPIISLDCDIDAQVRNYCRPEYFIKDFPNINNYKYKETIYLKKLMSKLKELGISSPLAPDVDNFIDNSSSRKRINFLLDLSKNNSMFLVFKHFGYDARLGDAHIKSFLNPISDSEFNRILIPYKIAEKKNIPYGIMLSHHSLPLDPNVPLVQSKKINEYIRKTFPNALILSDEIKMKGLLKDKNLYDLTKSIETDVLIFNSGNLKYSVQPIILGLKNKSDDEQSFKSVEKILIFKYKLGLIKFERLNNN